MAKGEPPLADLHPMRVLFIIPRESPPQLHEHFSRPMKEFVSLCLKKLPAERPSAKELLKHRFIRNARKTPKLVERIRERPKYQIKEHENSPDGTKVLEGSDTIKVSRVEDTVQIKNTGWDFSIEKSTNTGTVKSSVKPPQIRIEKTDSFPNQPTVNRFSVNSRDPLHEEDDSYEDDEDISPVGSGTVVVRPLKSKKSSFSDDSDSSRTPKSKLGSQEVASTASHEDSAINLVEANAAIQGGMKKGNSRDRFRLTKVNKDVQESITPEKSTNSNNSSRDFQDAIKSFTKPRETSDDEEEKLRITATSASATLSTLLIPSLKEEISDDLGAPIVNLVINSLMDMEYTKPGSCEFLVTRILHRLASSKEPGLKNLQEVATRGFSKGKKVNEKPENAKVEADSKKKQQNYANLSPLARFLLSRTFKINGPVLFSSMYEY